MPPAVAIYNGLEIFREGTGEELRLYLLGVEQKHRLQDRVGRLVPNPSRLIEIYISKVNVPNLDLIFCITTRSI